MDIEVWIERFKKVHGDFFDYSKFIDYNGSEKPIEIICPTHGSFKQTPYVHSKGHGCNKCYRDRVFKSTYSNRVENFKRRIEEKFSNRISINYKEYHNDSTPITFICNGCKSTYKSIPNRLLDKSRVGCTRCWGKGFNIQTEGYFNKYEKVLNKEDGYLYLINLYNEKEDFYKVGITSRDSIVERLWKIPYSYKEVLFIHTSMYDAFCIEQRTLKYMNKYKYTPKIYFGGFSECLKGDVEEIKDFINLSILERYEP